MGNVFEELRYSDGNLITPVLETVAWLEEYEHPDPGGGIKWDILPGKDINPDQTLTSQTSLYGGTAGIALFLQYDEVIWVITKSNGSL